VPTIFIVVRVMVGTALAPLPTLQNWIPGSRDARSGMTAFSRHFSGT
jgi:hypothetical protein